MIQFPPADQGHTELFGEPNRIKLLSEAAHIVVIDDEAANLRLLSAMLERAGFHTVTALTDARDLAQLIVESPVDLVITDLHMPICDGFGVLDILTPLINLERLPVLVVTGDTSRDARQRILTRGAKDFVTRPFDMIELILRVRNLLESRMLYQDLRKQNRALSNPRRAAPASWNRRASRSSSGSLWRRNTATTTRASITGASATYRRGWQRRSGGRTKMPACCAAPPGCTTSARLAFPTRCCANPGR